MTLTPFGETVAAIVITALIGALGWVIQSQILTNKQLAKAITDAVLEFKIAMELINQRNENQKTLCEMYRGQMGERCKFLDKEIDELRTRVEKIQD